MLSETERDSLSDILFNIDLANSFAQGFDYERFQAPSGDPLELAESS